MLETDGVCKSALIGVLAIHLAQRERQLSQILRAPSPNRKHALQCIEAGDDAEVGAALLHAYTDASLPYCPERPDVLFIQVSPVCCLTL